MKPVFWSGKWRFRILLVVFLLVIPLASSLIVIGFPAKVSVGIVLVDDCDVFYAEVAEEGFARYDEFFTTEILDTRLDSTGLRKKGSRYLTIDLNNRTRDMNLRESYEVDVILVITNYPVRNWINNPYVVSGEAEPATGSCVASVFGHEWDSEFNRNFIKHITLHEVSHLLGFRHCPDFDCAMHRSKYGTEFCPEHRFELPYRAALYSLGIGVSFNMATFIITSVLTLFFLPFFILYALMIKAIFSKYLHWNPESSILSLGVVISLSYFIIIISSTALFGLAICLLIIPLIESFFYFKTYLENSTVSN
jgi:hypothetical protein